MIDNSDFQAAEEAIIELVDRLDEIIDGASSDQWKDSHVEQMSNFSEIMEKLKELGYEPEGSMTKSDCSGCYNNDYNHGLGGATECWSFKTAKMILRKEVHIDQVPPWNQKAKRLPSCYQRQRFVYVGPNQTC